MEREPVTIGIGDEGGEADGALHEFRRLDALFDERFAHRRHVVDLERRAELRSRDNTDARAVADSEGRRTDVEFGPPVAEGGLARLQPNDVTVERDRARDVVDRICDECNILNHGSLRRTMDESPPLRCRPRTAWEHGTA